MSPLGPLSDQAQRPEAWTARSAVAVCAHPDDESFGLGGVLMALRREGTEVSLLSFTHGEASTLGAGDGPLDAIRAEELHQAASVLGARRTDLLAYPDSRLSTVPLEVLAGHVEALATEVGADTLLTFDLGGITGHPDHQRATEAALQAGEQLGLPVLGWALAAGVAAALRAETGVEMVGRVPSELDIELTVDREAQQRAISCHRSQLGGNTVLRRRLELQGATEHLRWLRRPGALSVAPA